MRSQCFTIRIYIREMKVGEWVSGVTDFRHAAIFFLKKNVTVNAIRDNICLSNF